MQSLPLLARFTLPLRSAASTSAGQSSALYAKAQRRALNRLFRGAPRRPLKRRAVRFARRAKSQKLVPGYSKMEDYTQPTRTQAGLTPKLSSTARQLSLSLQPKTKSPSRLATL
jgi:hypothetical protein